VARFPKMVLAETVQEFYVEYLIDLKTNYDSYRLLKQKINYRMHEIKVEGSTYLVGRRDGTTDPNLDDDTFT
jgi:hypothetical protein